MKKISAIMSILLALSLLPVSVFAETYPQFNLATGTVQEYAITNSNQEVRFRIELGKDLDLNEGRAIFQINNAKLAKGTDVATASIYQGSMIKNAPDITLTSSTLSCSYTLGPGSALSSCARTQKFEDGMAVVPGTS